MDETAPLSSPTWADFVSGWELGIYPDPVLCAAIAGAVLGFLSVYVVLRRMVFVSAGVTQAAGLGVALSFYAGIHWGLELSPVTGATVLALLAALLLARESRRGSHEVLLGWVYALAGGGAVVIGSRITQEANDIQAILFGTAVLVEHGDLVRVAVAGAVILALQLWWFRGVAFASFDPVAAQVQGLPVRLLRGALLLSIGVMVGVSARALGALPVFAFSVLPGAAALALASGPLAVPFALAALLGAVAGAGGYLVAFFWELPVGGAQTVVAALAYLVAATLGRLTRRT